MHNPPHSFTFVIYLVDMRYPPRLSGLLYVGRQTHGQTATLFLSPFAYVYPISILRIAYVYELLSYSRHE